MRCLQCNAEMALIGAVPADATLPGFEHHTFSCSACNEIERRLLFTGTKSLPSSSTWVRAVEKLVSKQKALKEEQALAKKSSHQASAVEKPLSSGRTANPRPDASSDERASGHLLNCRTAGSPKSP